MSTVGATSASATSSAPLSINLLSTFELSLSFFKPFLMPLDAKSPTMGIRPTPNAAVFAIVPTTSPLR